MLMVQSEIKYAHWFVTLMAAKSLKTKQNRMFAKARNICRLTEFLPTMVVFEKKVTPHECLEHRIFALDGGHRRWHRQQASRQ